jgi:hypothetical protein
MHYTKGRKEEARSWISPRININWERWDVLLFYKPTSSRESVSIITGSWVTV